MRPDVDPAWLWIPTLNAGLNALATCLLVVGRAQARSGRLEAHRRTMLAALAVSVLFLVCYLIYHAEVGSVRFQGTGPIRTVYLSILASHTVLAALVPFLALRTVWLANRGRNAEHRALAVWTWPIWVYVSITGVVVYAMLYQLPRSWL